MTSANFFITSAVAIFYCELLWKAAVKGWLDYNYKKAKTLLRWLIYFDILCLCMSGSLSLFVDIYFQSFYYLVIYELRKDEIPVKEEHPQEQKS
jgi:hypothetical protein